jgi:hypothetical protein
MSQPIIGKEFMRKYLTTAIFTASFSRQRELIRERYEVEIPWGKAISAVATANGWRL